MNPDGQSISLKAVSSVVSLPITRAWTSIGSWLWLEIGSLSSVGEGERGQFTLDTGGGQWRVIETGAENEVLTPESNELLDSDLRVFTGQKISYFQIIPDKGGLALELGLSEERVLQIWLERDEEAILFDRDAQEHLCLKASGEVEVGKFR